MGPAHPTVHLLHMVSVVTKRHSALLLCSPSGAGAGAGQGPQGQAGVISSLQNCLKLKC